VLHLSIDPATRQAPDAGSRRPRLPVPFLEEFSLAGYIEDRWIKKKKDPVTGKRERTARYGKGKRYKVAGIPGVRDRSFDTLEDAKAWLRRAATDEERGEFVDPRDGSITLADYIATY